MEKQTNAVKVGTMTTGLKSDTWAVVNPPQQQHKKTVLQQKEFEGKQIKRGHVWSQALI